MVEDEDTCDLLDQLSMTEIEYVEETKKALTTHGGAENFAYTIDCDKFTWKKCISKDMSVKFGYTLLQKVSIVQQPRPTEISVIFVLVYFSKCLLLQPSITSMHCSNILNSFNYRLKEEERDRPAIFTALMPVLTVLLLCLVLLFWKILSSSIMFEP